MMIEQSKQQTILMQGEQARETLKLEYQLKTDMELKLQGIKGDYKLEETDMLNRSNEDREILRSLDTKSHKD